MRAADYDYDGLTQKTHELFRQLDVSPLFPIKPPRAFPEKSGLYVLVEREAVVHVGRTRNIRARLIQHAGRSPESASFAFKEARRVLNRPADYTPRNAKKTLMGENSFKEEFFRQTARVSSMSARFLVVEDPLDQYLLELFAHLRYDLDLTAFDTH